MATIQWRPQVNALTTPQSYRIQYVPRNTAGYNEMATDISSAHPNYSADLVLSLAPLVMEWIQQRLGKGDQVTLKDAFNFRLSCSGRLDNPNDPLPDNKNMLHVRITPARPFVRKIRNTAQMERLSMNEKLPQISSCHDTRLKLADVLNPEGVLRLTGSNLSFAEDDPQVGCVLQGTRNGATRQSTYGLISNTEVLLVPDIPAQDNPWNNEYLFKLATRYTEHGTLRNATYQRRLRTPLSVLVPSDADEPEVGILSSNSATPCVVITGGTLSSEEQLRIQALSDLGADCLLLRLLDLKEDGAKGPEIIVAANGNYTLTGFSGSAVSSLVIRVQDYAALKKMIREHYSGRLVDILSLFLNI